MNRYKHTETGEIKTHQQWQNELGMSFHADRLPEFLRIPERPAPAPLTPEQVLLQRQNQVRMDAEQSYREPVALADGTTWNGGFDSAVAIKGAADMADFSGSTTVVIYDSSNVEHVVSIADAKAVAVQIGADYQAKFAAKQAAMRALAAVDLAAPDAIEQLNAINFAAYLAP